MQCNTKQTNGYLIEVGARTKTPPLAYHSPLVGGNFVSSFSRNNIYSTRKAQKSSSSRQFLRLYKTPILRDTNNWVQLQTSCSWSFLVLQISGHIFMTSPTILECEKSQQQYKCCLSQKHFGKIYISPNNNLQILTTFSKSSSQQCTLGTGIHIFVLQLL